MSKSTLLKKTTTKNFSLHFSQFVILKMSKSTLLKKTTIKNTRKNGF